MDIGGSRGGLRGLHSPPPLVGKFYKKGSFLAIFRNATPLGPNGGQK